MNQHHTNELCKKEANKALEKILNAEPVSTTEFKTQTLRNWIECLTTEIRELNALCESDAPVIDFEYVHKRRKECLVWRGIYQRAFDEVMEQQQ